MVVIFGICGPKKVPIFYPDIWVGTMIASLLDTAPTAVVLPLVWNVHERLPLVWNVNWPATLSEKFHYGKAIVEML